MKLGLEVDLRIAAIPTARPVACRLPPAFWQRHPGIAISIAAQTSTEVMSPLEEPEARARLTDLANASVGGVA